MTPPIAAWATFFSAEVNASAALTGLIIVALSINLTRIPAFAQLSVRADEASKESCGSTF